MKPATQPQAGQRALEQALQALTQLVRSQHASRKPPREAGANTTELLALAQATLWQALARVLEGAPEASGLFPSLLRLPLLEQGELLAEVGRVQAARAHWRTEPSGPVALERGAASAQQEEIGLLLTKAAHGAGLHALASWVCGADALDELELVLTGLLAGVGLLVVEPALPETLTTTFAALIADTGKLASGPAPRRPPPPLPPPGGFGAASARSASLEPEVLRAAPAPTVQAHAPQREPQPAQPAHSGPERTARPADELKFSVYRPRQVLAEEWTPLLAFAHLAEKRADAPADAPDPSAQVKAQAEALLGPAFASYRELSEDAGQPVPFEGQLTFVPRIPGVRFDPPEHTFRWVADIHRAEFRLYAPRETAGSTLHGELSVYFGSILIAALGLSVPVVVQRTATDAAPVAESARRYRKIFASYSHRDANTVGMFRELARAFGDRYLIDVADLRAGEAWSSALETLIREADVFQLFWSSQSMRSPFVRQEWEYALSLGRSNFIRPSYWETPLPEAPPDLPPPALRALHFQKVADFSTREAAAPPVPRAAANRIPSGTFASTSDAARKTAPETRTRVWGSSLGALALVLVALLAWVGSERSTSSDTVPTSAGDDYGAVGLPPEQPPVTGSPVGAQRVRVYSRPTRAQLYLDGRLIGFTPLELEREQAHGTLELVLEGYPPLRQPVDLRGSTSSVLVFELGGERRER